MSLSSNKSLWETQQPLACRPKFGSSVAFLAYFLLWALPVPSADAWQSKQDLPKRAKEILANHCLDCHQGEEPEAGLDLDSFPSLKSIQSDSHTWKKVLQRVVAENMPPEDSSTLSDQDRKWLAQWVDDTLHKVDCTSVQNVGKVTIRRLTRREYQNTIEDLLGVRYQPASSFPGDDSGYGFDNIGDVLSLPPVLFEKYLKAAETITKQAIPAPEDQAPNVAKIDLSKGRREGGTRFSGNGSLAFYSNGTFRYALGKIKPGKYQLQLKVSGTQAGPGTAEVKVYLDRRRLTTQKVPGHQQVKAVDLNLSLRHRKHQIVVNFDNDFYAPEARDKTKRDRNLYVHSIHLTGPIGKSAVNHQGSRFFFTYPKTKSDEPAKAKRLLQVWCSRLYRRPATKDETDKLLKIYQLARAEKFSFEKSLQFAVQGILVSPKFLFKVESPVNSKSGQEPLTDYELATRLSYFLWNSTPDNELLKVAVTKNLQDPKVLESQIQRLLADPKANRFIHDFSSQWLQLRSLEIAQPDPELFKIGDSKLLRDMQKETQLFFGEFVHNNLPISQMLTAKFSFLNRRLAEHYSLQRQRRKTLSRLIDQDASGKKIFSGFQKIDLTGSVRGGLLTQGSFLTATSNPTRTSPVKRGKWIMENLLGEEPPPPSADVMALEQQQLTGTLRQRMEQHRTDPACASCHKVMDPLGFSLERFDAVGRLRKTDSGLPIDDHGELPTGEKFQGAIQLREMLAKSKRKDFLRTLTEKMMTYAVGRGLRYEDQCTVNDITKELEKDDRIQNLIRQIILSPSFRMKQK